MLHSTPGSLSRRTSLAPVLFLAAALALAVGLAFVAPAPAFADEATEEAVADERPPVTLYMTTWCGWCRKTRELLTELDAPFVEVDIEKSDEGRAEYNEKSGGQSGVPLIDIDGTLVRGYQEDRIKELVADLEES